MPIMLTRKDGPPTPFRNAEYIPFYYFIPKSILSRCGAELNAIPRNPQELFHNRAACEFVESDLFRLLIIDATAFMVWPYMGFGEYMEIYSGYDPAWRFALPGLVDPRADGRRHLGLRRRIIQLKKRLPFGIGVCAGMANRHLSALHRAQCNEKASDGRNHPSGTGVPLL